MWLIDYPTTGAISLMVEGAALAPKPDLSVSVVDRLRAIMTGPQRDALDVLLRSNAPDGLSREQLALRAGWSPSSGHVKNVLGSLRTHDVVEYPRQGFVAQTPWVTGR